MPTPKEMMGKTRGDIRLYHVDHLGSTSLVTDIDGEITQHVAYIPYGEVFVEQRNGSWNTPYLFNAKELDEETGLYYYGARYLDPTNAAWLSVDPLFEKYVGMSPYNYCAGNPVKLVDPTGMDGYFFNEDGTFNRVIPEKGEHYGYIIGKDIRFNFADSKNDPKAIDNGDIKYVSVIPDEMIDNALRNSGTQDIHNPITYLYNESSTYKVDGKSAKMDYYVNANFTRDGKSGVTPLEDVRLYISYSKSTGYIAHNAHNFGNFLWGAGACSLHLPLAGAVFGAHINNYFFDPDPTINHTFDSEDDQFSIRCGYNWVRDQGWFSGVRNLIDDANFSAGTYMSKGIIPFIDKEIIPFIDKEIIPFIDKLKKIGQ